MAGSMSVGSLYVDLKLNEGNFHSSLGRAHSGVQGFSGALGGLATRVAAGIGVYSLLSGAFRGVGEAITGSIGAIVTAGVSYQDQMNTLQAVTGASTAQMKQLDAKAIELGNDLSLPSTSAADAARAMTELTKSGLSVQDSMDAAKGVLQLAAAAGVDEGTAATYAADALNSFHLKGKDAIMVADLLAGAANASSGEITDMALSLQQAGAVFSAAHVPIQDTVTLISELAQNGVRGSDAGTSLKSMMLALQTPTTQQATLMKQLNIRLYDAHGQMRSFRDIIKDVQGPLGKLTQAQRDHAFGVIFGSDAVRSANIVFGSGVKTYDDMEKAVTKAGSAQEVAAAKAKGLGGAWRGLQSQIETVELLIFQKFAPGLEAAVSRISAAFGGMMRDIQAGASPTTVLTGVLVNLGLSTHQVEEAMRVLGPLLTGIISGFQNFWHQIQSGLPTLLKWVGIMAKEMAPNLREIAEHSRALGVILEGLALVITFQIVAMTKVASVIVGVADAFLEAAEAVRKLLQYLPGLGLLLDGVSIALDHVTGSHQRNKQATDDSKNSADGLKFSIRDLNSELLSAQNAGLAYQRAQLQVAEALKQQKEAQDAANQAVAKYGPNSEAAARAQENLTLANLGAKEAFLAEAAAAVENARQQAEVKGASFSAADAMRVQRDTLLQIASTLAPDSPLRKYLDDYINTLNNKIPKEINTHVTVTGLTAQQAAQLKARGVKPGVIRAEGRQSGGPVIPGGLYTVGEHGPETLVMNAVGGYVVPSSTSQRMDKRGSGRAVTVNQYFQGSTADHRAMMRDAAWDARRLR